MENKNVPNHQPNKHITPHLGPLGPLGPLRDPWLDYIHRSTAGPLLHVCSGHSKQGTLGTFGALGHARRQAQQGPTWAARRWVKGYTSTVSIYHTFRYIIL